MVYPLILIDSKHLLIVKDILSRRDYSFFAFGSRVQGHPKKFSDLDLLYYEKIDSAILSKLEEDFEESDLPFQIDLVSYHECDPNFQQLLSNHIVCLQSSSDLRLIENNHLKHFMYQPKTLGYPIDCIHGITVINCGLGTSMLNIAYGAPSIHDLSHVITDIKGIFGSQPFAWWIPPSERHPIISYAMMEHGFQKDVTEHAMICRIPNLLGDPIQSDLSIQQVINMDMLDQFMNVLKVYDPLAINFFKNIDENTLLNSQEKLFIGNHHDITATIAMLLESDHSCSIFTLMTRKDMQHKGYETAMMHFLMNVAGHHRFVTLSASSDSGYGIYERLGFLKISEFDCFEYG